MNVTNKIEIHLDDKRHMPPIDVVQGDMARAVEISLHFAGTAWTVPPGAKVYVRYRRPDGAGGVYDTLQDNKTSAYSISGSTVTVTLVPEMLAVAGAVPMQVVINSGGAELATFTINLRVQRDPSIGAVKPEDYINLRQTIADEVEKAMTEMGVGGTLRITITENPWAADKTFAEIYAAYTAGQAVECVLPGDFVLHLMAADESSVCFQGVINREYQRVVVKADDTVSYNSGRYALPGESNDFTVTVFPAGDGYVSEQSYDDVLQEYDIGRTVCCDLETEDQRWLHLPMVKVENGVFYFSAVCEGVEYLVELTRDTGDNTVVTVAQRELADGGNGNPGEDGGYYTPTVADNGDGTMTVSFSASEADMPAIDPVTISLPAGKDGMGIKQVAMNGNYTLTIVFDDGTPYTTPSIRGEPGPAGYTPVKGVDYWTEEDKAEMVADVLAALPAAEGVGF